MVIATDDNTYAAISSHAMGFRVVLSSEEMAEISVRNDFGEAELKAVEKSVCLSRQKALRQDH